MIRLRRKAITQLVAHLLAENGITQAPVPVKRVAKSLGLVIRCVPNDDDGVSGFLLKNTASKQAVIGVNENHSNNRQRFTIAHEIGHFLLHVGDPVHIDARANYRIVLRSGQSSKGEHPREIEANAFAAELLMPEAFLERDLQQDERGVDLSDDEALRWLATKYRVSIAALTFRLANLGFLRL